MKRLSTVIVASLAIVIMTGAVYAAATLSITNTITITAGTPNLFLALVTSGTTTCASVPQTSYSDTSLAIAWGNVAQGATVNQLVCLQNTGASHALSITVSSAWDAAHGTLTATIGGTNASGQTVNNGPAVLMSFVVAVNPNAPTGPVTFTITIA
jgi:hypothetical protein